MPSTDDTSRGRPPGDARTGPRLALGVLLGLWVAVAAFHPFTPSVPQPGLDASWVIVMGEAADRGLRWGHDLAFTYGPASPLVTGYFNGAYLTLTLPLLLGACLLFGLATALLVRAARPAAAAGVAAAAGLVAALSSGFPDALFLALPLAPFLLLLGREPPGAARTAVAAAAAVAVGAVGMAKMSFPLAALPLFLLGDAAALPRRRFPALTLPCCLGLLAADALYGQSLADLPAFVQAQGEVVAGYSEAMALDGDRAELLGFALAAAALLAGVAAAEWAAPRRAGSRFAVPLGLAWALLVLFKAGFVRQDAHTLIAWFGLALAAVLAAAGRFRAGSSAAVSLAAVAVAAALGLSLVGPTARGGVRGAAALSAAERVLLAGPLAQLRAASDLLHDPAGTAAAFRAAKAARWPALAELAPLPRLDGAVDVIPSQQGRVVANGLDLRARPSFQEYGTYTPALAAANRAFVEGPRAPEWVLFGPESPDGGMTLDRRYPNFAEGALWLDLLELYRPERRVGELIALRRRAVPAPIALGPPRRLEVGLDEDVPVGPVAGDVRAVLAAVEVRPTLLGRLAGFLFRPAPLTMSVRFADGHAALYQFVSGIASAGFVLSPRVDNASEFEALADGAAPPPARVVAALSIHAPPRLRALVEPRVVVTLRAAEGGGAPPPAEPSSAWASLAAAQGLAPDAPDVAARPPAVLDVPALGLSRLDLGFGLALDDGAPPGAERVCFAVRPVDGSGRELWRRCLDRAAAADREPQRLSLALPPGTSEVALRTTCEADCGEDVEAYWAPP